MLTPKPRSLPLFAWMFGILALSILIGLPLFQGAMLNTHDSFLCLTRIACVKKAWLEGQLFPRWASDMIFGYGYPILNFYQPSFQYLAGLLSFFTKNIVEAQNLASFLVYFSSGITMFIFTASLWGRPAGFLAAAAYLFFPYHLTDLYIRGAYTELTAFALLPFILWSLKRLADTLKTRYLLSLTCGITLLSLSHNITNMLFLPWLGLFSAILLLTRKESRLEFFFKTGAAFVFGFGLASFFILPAILEQKYVQIDKITSGQYDFHQNFLALNQLTKWIWHYTGPGQGPYSGVSFELGIVHLALLLLALVWAIKYWQNSATPKHLLIFFLAMGLVSLFMTTSWSLPVWNQLPFLKFVQFPSRFLVLTGLALSVLIGFCTAGLKKNHTIALVTIGVILLAGINFAYCRPASTQNPALVNNTLDVRATPPGENGEFLPVSFKQLRWPRSPNAADIWKGEGQILAHHAITSIQHEFTITARTPVLVGLNTFYFPGWTVREQKQEIPLIKDSPYGLIFFTLPAGEHHLEVRFGNTPLRQLAALLSLASLLGLLTLVVLIKKRNWLANKKQTGETA
ncbi:MAG: hypothetical protein HQL20_10120 [Candidatus Omnitrophica bacterium]|nr:hypothetical protein [Candidatus Omnitrophota bacterium]